ncbi:MAG: Eco57I restriction-modification methylase domain-containing protein [Pyrinomonadaceae bacterium]
MKKLDDEKRDGIWAHYDKNAFAPVYMGKFDFVVGNPPWIRWGYLSAEYRERTLSLWHNYGLFSLKGHETRLGAGEKDFSMLFTYACADRYLADKGRLSFVITGEVFKLKGAGEGFRRFRIGQSGPDLKALWMEDMIELQPFQAANKTTIFAIEKGSPTKYPVPTVEWKRNEGVGKIPPESTLESVEKLTTRYRHEADPIESNKRVSSWQTGSRSELRRMSALKGANTYKAHLGARVEPYGIFWLNLIDVRPDGMVVVENQHDRGKTNIKHVRTAIELSLVFPAVAGGDLLRYGIKSHFYALIAQDPESRQGYEEDWLSENNPLTHAYLSQFKNELIARAAYQKYFIREIKKAGKVVKRIPREGRILPPCEKGRIAFAFGCEIRRKAYDSWSHHGAEPRGLCLGGCGVHSFRGERDQDVYALQACILRWRSGLYCRMRGKFRRQRARNTESGPKKGGIIP